MKIFRCSHCDHPVFFENVSCLNCGSTLAFLPEALDMTVVVPVPEMGTPAPDSEDTAPDVPLWQAIHPTGDGDNSGAPRYRHCGHRTAHPPCNFVVAADDDNTLCVSCRQTRLLPDLSQGANPSRWARIEVAKRRLYYTLARLGLQSPNTHPADIPTFDLLADLPGQPVVMTGHHNGVITLNVAEADDDERARRRLQLREPYRTLLGHLRHESGHFYWERLVVWGNRLDDFRALFGDESQDYAQALDAHYARQNHDWQTSHVSAYATAHPWEDWAETWAHYLHMVDLLETAAAYSTRLQVPGAGEEDCVSDPFAAWPTDFDQLAREWVPVTLLLNSLNRSLGQDDAYPFALYEGAMHKLRFVHDLIQASGVSAPVQPAPPPVTEDTPAEVVENNDTMVEAAVQQQTQDDTGQHQT